MAEPVAPENLRPDTARIESRRTGGTSIMQRLWIGLAVLAAGRGALVLVPEIARLDGDTLDLGSGEQHPMTPGELFLAVDRRLLVRREVDGGYTTLTAPEGSSLPVTARPPSAPISPGPSTLQAVQTSAGWLVDPSSFSQPVTHDTPLTAGPDDSPERWSMSTDAPTFREQFRDCEDAARMFLWLCGQGDAVRTYGGQGWPIPANFDPSPYGVPAEVIAAEYLGADTLIEARIMGERFVARTPGKAKVTAGDNIRLSWKPEQTHWFDTESRRRYETRSVT